MKTWQELRNKPQLFNRYLIREKVISALRNYFLKNQYHEIEVPLMASALLVESYVEIFETHLLDRQRRTQRAFLTTSPEIFLKKLLSAGIGNCFTICKSFRNTETMSGLHNPEFTILEWYEVGKDYQKLMQTTEEMISCVFKTLKLPNLFKYQDQMIDMTLPWQRMSMREAFSKFVQVDLENVLTIKLMKILALKKGYKVEKNNTWEELFNQIYLNEVAPNLGKTRPVFIYDYPVQLAALAQKKQSDPRFCERAELYIGGLEIGDGCTELTNWQELKKRFMSETREIARLGKTSYPYDKEFILAHKTGLPKCAGMAMGIDRLLMLLTDSPRIQDVLFFPAEELFPASRNKLNRV